MKNKRIMAIIIMMLIILGTNVQAGSLPSNQVNYMSKGQDVVNIQKALNKVGFNIKVDGSYGPATKRAIIEFQGRYNMKDNTGIYNATTKELLDATGEIPIEESDNIHVMVNKENYLSKDYIPKDLRKVNLPSAEGKNQMRHIAATALEELFQDAKIEGHNLYAQSGYRSYARQNSIFYNYIKTHGRTKTETFSAPPGSSEHQTGLAMDVSSKSVGYALVERFAEVPEGKWLKDNSWKYGFIIRYPKDKTHITKYTYEPWHIRYVGKEIAKEIYEKGQVYEEYMEEIKE